MLNTASPALWTFFLRSGLNRFVLGETGKWTIISNVSLNRNRTRTKWWATESETNQNIDQNNIVTRSQCNTQSNTNLWASITLHMRPCNLFSGRLHVSETLLSMQKWKHSCKRWSSEQAPTKSATTVRRMSLITGKWQQCEGTVFNLCRH